ncbi:MAG: hypothetical protein R3B54_05540 [Bdellovibrionota bacterium]
MALLARHCFARNFPSLVNGWITASGGAWNASIVSEYVSFEGKVLAATGIGTSITEAAQRGTSPNWRVAFCNGDSISTDQPVFLGLAVQTFGNQIPDG